MEEKQNFDFYYQLYPKIHTLPTTEKYDIKFKVLPTEYESYFKGLRLPYIYNSDPLIKDLKLNTNQIVCFYRDYEKTGAYYYFRAVR